MPCEYQVLELSWLMMRPGTADQFANANDGVVFGMITPKLHKTDF